MYINNKQASLSTIIKNGDSITIKKGKNTVEKTTIRKKTLQKADSPYEIDERMWTKAQNKEEIIITGKISKETKISIIALKNPRLKIKNSIALTFDDGPSIYTPRILQLLQKYHIKATFCEIGNQAQQKPELSAEIIKQGNQLCDHTKDHDQNMPQHDLAHNKIEVLIGKHQIEKAGGVPVKLFRFPGGDSDAVTRKLVQESKMYNLLWNVDPKDWSRPGVANIIHTVLEQTKAGSVILCHDGGGNREETIMALKYLIPKLQKEGYTFTLA